MRAALPPHPLGIFPDAINEFSDEDDDNNNNNPVNGENERTASVSVDASEN